MWGEGGKPKSIYIIVSDLVLPWKSILRFKTEGGKPNSIYLVPDLLEEIFLLLPLKSILRFKTVSKQWKSILESKLFLERRMRLQKSRRKILAVYNCECGRPPRLLPESIHKGDEEIISLHFSAEAGEGCLMACDGLVCFAEPNCINVLNPSTRQRRRFPSDLWRRRMSTPFGAEPPRSWAMGFGRDKVTGSYKVVTIHFGVFKFCLLDVETGEWRKLSRPPKANRISDVRTKSACVNGSIYWISISLDRELLALDLHEEKFHVVSVPDKWITSETQLVNLEDRLAMAKRKQVGPEWILEILTMDVDEERWSKTYSISLTNRVVDPDRFRRWFTPVAVSKRGNLVFYDNENRLFKYYPVTDEIRCLSLRTQVISLYLENLVPLPLNGSPDPLSSYDWTRYKCPFISTADVCKFKLLQLGITCFISLFLMLVFYLVWFLSRIICNLVIFILQALFSSFD